MNYKTAGWAAQMSPGSRILIHTVRAAHGRGKRPSGEFAKSPCQGAIQVIPGISVRAGKTRAAATKQICHAIHGCSSSQQLFSDPLVGDAPIGARESLWNPQPLQPSLVNGGGLRRGVGRRDHPLAGAWSGSGDGAGSAAYLLFRGFYQHSPAARQARLSVQEPHPGSVPIALAPEGFLVGEPRQPPQMAPVGATQIASIDVGQLSGDGCGRGRLQTDRTDLNPSLEMAGAGLEHHTGLMPAEPHPLDCGGRIGVVQIQQNVASVAVVRIGLKVHVTAFPITNAQESQRRLLAQLSGGPQPFSRECGSSGVVNQPNQIEITRHRGKLSPDRAQRKEQPTIRHKHNGRRANSPYNALMLCLRGRKRKSIIGNGRCQNSKLSQNRAQASSASAQSFAWRRPAWPATAETGII